MALSGGLYFEEHQWVLADEDFPGKFRLGDIRAERYILHSYAEHHCH